MNYTDPKDALQWVISHADENHVYATWSLNMLRGLADTLAGYAIEALNYTDPKEALQWIISRMDENHVYSTWSLNMLRGLADTLARYATEALNNEYNSNKSNVTVSSD